MELNEIFGLIITIASLLIAYLVYRISVRTHLSTKGNQDLAVYKTFIYEGYIEGGFSPEFKLSIDRKEYGYREARSKALKSYFVDSCAWRESSSIGSIGTETSWPWENQIAYHTADSLQNLGLSVISGSVPAGLVLISVSDSIIDDWLICKDWIKSYRDVESVHRLDSTEELGFTSFHRRHAEWIVLLAVLWMKKNWKYKNADLVIELYSDDGSGLSIMKNRFLEICQQDKVLMNVITRQEIKALIGINVPK